MRGKIEKSLIKQGCSIIGIDEVGRGCIAGPVVAACAALNYEKLFRLPLARRNLIRDSKTLSHMQRQDILPQIKALSIETFVGVATVEEIERVNIVQATFLAMRRALAKCRSNYDLLLVDGKQKVAGYEGEQRNIIGGDNLCFGIAAASIIAKEHRDSFMREQASIYPNYGFERHVGYGTKAHMQSIEAHGICPLHRKTFAPIAKKIETLF